MHGKAWDSIECLLLALIPYRPDINIDRVPWLTVLICVACLLVHVQDRLAFNSIAQGAYNQCNGHQNRDYAVTVASLSMENSMQTCIGLLLNIHLSANSDKLIEHLARRATPNPFIGTEAATQAFVADKLQVFYRRFETGVPRMMSQALEYEIGSRDITRMISANFAHADWTHLIGNVLGFLAFGILVEAIAGSVMTIALLVTVSIGTNIATSLWFTDLEAPMASIGLSGSVFAVMGALAFLWPRARIRCWLWVVILFRRISLPAWILAALYTGWNVLYLANQPDSNINFIAHISGALLGFIIAATWMRWQKAAIQSTVDQS